MGRLTRKHESGEFYLPRRYKDENGNNIIPSNQDAINKLAHYEDLEEQGRLVEQKHGRWIWVQEHLDHTFACYYECSECGRIEESKEPYCHCGAKMDEVENE